METSGCAPAEEYLCQAFSDVILAVNDVDAEDGGDPNLCSEYVKDIYDYLRQLEVSIVVQNLCFLSKLHLALSKRYSINSLSISRHSHCGSVVNESD